MVVKEESSGGLQQSKNFPLQIQLFAAFFRVGILGYGGGPSSIPLVHKEVVDKYKWMDDDEFSDILALGNALPGPIATKMAGYIGWRVGGFLGMLNAIVASVVPTIIMMIMLLTVLNVYKDKSWVQGMSKAVVPVVGVLLGVMTLNFIKQSKGALGWVVMSIIFIASLVVIELLGIHPAIVIGATLAYALLSPNKKEVKTE